MAFKEEVEKKKYEKIERKKRKVKKKKKYRYLCLGAKAPYFNII